MSNQEIKTIDIISYFTLSKDGSHPETLMKSP